MNKNPIKSAIDRARKRFNEDLHSKTYKQVHADDKQLQGLLSFLAPKKGQVFLDLGTGNGYVGMSIAQQFSECSVIGLDIAEHALQQNVEKAREMGLLNIQYEVFDGMTLPFDDGYLDGVVCRYTFHHFPEYEDMLNEISRTMRPGGRLVLTDPVKNEIDTTNFINNFQVLKQDGHIKIHEKKEFLKLVERHGFKALESFSSTISFSRNRTAEYDRLIDSTPRSVLDAYKVEKKGEQIGVTFDVLNSVFQKAS